MSLVWIASYPKSGNTWVRFLICNLVLGPQSSATALARLTPDLHELEHVPDACATPPFLKTHFPFSPGLPLASCSTAAIYVVRHPADVMLSNFYYARRRGGLAADDPAQLARYCEQYATARGDPRWIELQMGTWDAHVRSWLGAAAQRFPVLRLRYEDLLADPVQGARHICALLRLVRSDADIERAAAAASFRRMREIEEADIAQRHVGVFYKPYLRPSIDSGLRFMRSGRAGESEQALTAEQRARLAAAFGPLTSELGY